ncbi:hypothetical protein AB0M20_37865 [Actinoplanes sp. NPDC051633]|uniref:hypothetical protein n=1 Tax=Actinoplanes sp. NPDC051633 TaxID=3155670 RepID=UPI0034171F0F
MIREVEWIKERAQTDLSCLGVSRETDGIIAAAQAIDPTVIATSINTGGHAPGSDHFKPGTGGKGLAADFDFVQKDKAARRLHLAKEFKRLYTSDLDELIYSPMTTGLGNQGREVNILSFYKKPTDLVPLVARARFVKREQLFDTLGLVLMWNSEHYLRKRPMQGTPVGWTSGGAFASESQERLDEEVVDGVTRHASGADDDCPLDKRDGPTGKPVICDPARYLVDLRVHVLVEDFEKKLYGGFDVIPASRRLPAVGHGDPTLRRCVEWARCLVNPSNDELRTDNGRQAGRSRAGNAVIKA